MIMKLEQYGYREEKVKVREMPIAELKVGLFKFVKENGIENDKVRILDLYDGTVNDYDTVADFLLNDWNEKVEIKLYGISILEKYVYADGKEDIQKMLYVKIQYNEDDE